MKTKNRTPVTVIRRNEMGLQHCPQVSDFHSFCVVFVYVVFFCLCCYAGDIGGNMGLFLGCSLLTLFEFVDLFWNLLRSPKSKDENGVEDLKNPGQNEARIP